MDQDRAARTYAVPVRGTIWGLNYNDQTERNIGQRTFDQAGIDSDYNDYFPGTEYDGSPLSPVVGASDICPIRILQPHYGEIIECFADLQITPDPVDTDLTLRLAIGRFQSGSYDRELSYSEADIAASWLKISGTDAPLAVSGGVIAADLLNLLSALPKYGEANFREDAFVLILVFNKVPTLTSFSFDYLNIHSSVTGAV